MCRWRWSERDLLWRTDCGAELTDSDEDELVADYGAEFCPWCGHRIELVDDSLEAQRARDAHVNAEADWRREIAMEVV